MTAEAAKTATTTVQEKKPVAEKQTNCLGCSKPLKKIKQYYRNGKYYCNKKCWRNHLAKLKEAKK